MAEVAADTVAGGEKTYEGIVPVTILKVVGIELTSIGRSSRPSPDDEVIALEDDAGTKYRKLVISGGRIIGAILLGYRPRSPRCGPRSPQGADVSTAPGGRCAGATGGCWRGNSAAACGVFAGMKPRIRTAPPRDRRAGDRRRGRGASPFPAAANAAVTPQFANGTLTVTGDDASRQHHARRRRRRPDHAQLPRTARPAASRTTPTSIPARARSRVPSDGTVNLVVNGGGGNDNINVSAAELRRPPAINGGDGDDMIVGTALVDTIDGGNGNDRITGFRGNETIHGGDGNDVIIWNNGDGNDTNEGDAGVDETLITEGNADDGNAVTQSGAAMHFDARQRAASRSTPPTRREAVADVLLGQRHARDRRAASPIGMNIDAGPGGTTRSPPATAARPHPRRPRQRHLNGGARRRHAGLDQRRRQRHHERRRRLRRHRERPRRRRRQLDAQDRERPRPLRPHQRGPFNLSIG